MWKKFRRQITVENNTDSTFRVRYTIFNNWSMAKTRRTTSYLYGLYKTYEILECTPITIERNPFFPHHNKILFGDNSAYYVVYEIMNQNNIVIRQAKLNIGDVWSIDSVSEEELNQRIQQEIPLEIIQKPKSCWSTKTEIVQEK